MSASRTSTVFAVVSFLLAASAARAQDAVEVTASALNVRTGPGTSHAAVGLAHQGEVYPVLARQGEWVRLQFGARDGWSHGTYLRASPAEVKAVAADSLNVRSGGSTRYRALGQLPRGARVAVRASSGEWRRIDFEGRAGWVHGAYLVAPGSNTPVTPPPPTTTRPRSRAGFIQLRASGPGFRSIAPASRRWGTPTMVYGLERIALRWRDEQPGAPRMSIEDISYENGGPISGHVSHQRGVDVDVWPIRRDASEGAVTRLQLAYSRTRTAALLRLFRAELPITLILFNDAAIPGVSDWPNHDNHFHARIR
jgi:uncharacterized protein YraI